MNDANQHPDQSPENRPNDVPFSSNAVRLSPREWLVAAGVLVLLAVAVPRAWKQIEPLDAGADYRVPYSLGNDYWNYDRTCEQLAAPDKVLLLGDSVVWGHYVTSDATLSHWLNRQAGEERFVNLGLDGCHPAALLGLVENYGKAISNHKIVVNFNLLWLSSPRHDLSEPQESAANHPALIPQFSPPVPGYKATLSEKLGVLAGRHVGCLSWAEHLRTAYFQGKDLARWSLEHPYASPLGQVDLRLPSPDETPSPVPDVRPWSQKRIALQTPDWVALDDSLQWRLFIRTIEVLRERGNRVFVLIGPYNEHTLTAKGRQAYHERRDQAAAQLAEQGIPHYAPPALPSEQYADASHPLSEGYKLLANWLHDQEAFTAFVKQDEPR